MNYYRIHGPKYNDYEEVIKNGFAYTKEQSGYYDLIEKGYPTPLNIKTILAELYSPNVPPVLWSTLTAVWICAFLITDKLLKEFQKKGFSGFISVMAGIDKSGNFSGYEVLEHAETPGLGSKMGVWFNNDSAYWALFSESRNGSFMPQGAVGLFGGLNAGAEG